MRHWKEDAMKLRSAAAVLFILCGTGAGDALAQFPPVDAQQGQFPPAGAPQGQFPSAGAPQSPFPPAAGPQAQPGAPPCYQGFVPLQQETEKRGKLLQEAAKKKVPATEACGLFTRFVEAEGKMLKYMTVNQAECRIPPDTVKNVKASHERSTEMRGKVCEAAKSPKPAGPSLSDALGIRTPLPDSDTQKPGYGTFDTLTGNVLGR
jgi:hypothetical protein